MQRKSIDLIIQEQSRDGTLTKVRAFIDYHTYLQSHPDYHKLIHLHKATLADFCTNVANILYDMHYSQFIWETMAIVGESIIDHLLNPTGKASITTSNHKKSLYLKDDYLNILEEISQKTYIPSSPEIKKGS